jgi:iron(III) transport system substrate-binding protein
MECPSTIHSGIGFSGITPGRQLKRGIALVTILLASIFFGQVTKVLGKDASVVIYTSQDQVFADPIFKEFEKQTGIKVRAVFDSEAVKTVGLANRLLAESSHPQCDVFWSNEEFRTRQLASRNIFRETNSWAAMGYRTRRLVVNTNLLPIAKAPHTFSEATNQIWRGKVALAYPLFGTTATHFMALRQTWGEAQWQTWCHALVVNKPMVVDGNSVVVKMVGGGEAWFGFTDSDDIAAGQKDGLPIVELPVCDETLFIPNTIGVVRNSPHPAEAERLFQYLQSPAVLQRLIKEDALESAQLPKSGMGLKVDWNKLVEDQAVATAELEKIFLR